MHCLNLCLAYLLTPFVKGWQRRGLEFQLKHQDDNLGTISYAFHNWADDIFLFAKSPETLQTMLEEMAEVLKPMGGSLILISLNGCRLIRERRGW